MLKEHLVYGGAWWVVGGWCAVGPVGAWADPSPALPPLPADPPVSMRADGFAVGTADDTFGLRIGGRVQVRYAYERRPDAEDLSSFFIRRLRVDVRGYVHDPALTFRIMPELAREATLRDGWFNYAHTPRLQVRAGQMPVPFQGQRAISGMRQHFVERGLPSGAFGFPNGYDIGVMLHGRNEQDRTAYGFGIYDGAGRNVKDSHSRGNMVSTRVALAPLGRLPYEESDYAFSEAPQLAIGFGAQAAWLNEVRAWDLGRSGEEDPRAHWAAVTADARLAWRGLSLVTEGYLREVAPRADDVDRYDGWAWMVSIGCFLVPQRVEAVARYAQLRHDRSDTDTAESDWGAGVNLYLRGHRWKLRFNYLHHDQARTGRTEQFIIENHLQF